MVNELFLAENWFLIILGLIWVIGAVLQDMKRREVDNLWNFSLIAFALAYRIAVSIFINNYWFAFNGLIGLLIFLALGNLFYYARLFAGGDAKLMIALGTILPLSYSWIINFKIFGCFILLFLLGGSIYALIYSFCLIIINWKSFKKEFVKQWNNYKRLFLIALIFALAWVLIAFFISQTIMVLIGLIVLLFPVLYIFAKAVEESCMIRLVKPNKVTEGDWLYKDIRIGNRLIKANWEGVTKRELELIKKGNKKVLIKYGIPFTPSFLFGLVGLLFLAWMWFFILNLIFW
ncbi:MAG: hypothetical protein PHH54_04250 [Candidatus Nanoarchaeia archaeon]|nr:hypothetical protein [Candidatus Nanoarchaeia archaeon]MDD5741172.1 hypothetical protein [Candidatus Nanoarchaeia archaeon]